MEKTKKRSIGHIEWLSENKCRLRLSLGVDDFGKRIQPSKNVECSSEREAEQLLWEFYKEREKLLMKHNSYVPVNLAGLYEYWYKHHVSTLSELTAEWYEQLWNLYVKFAGKVKLETISQMHILSIIDKVESQRNKNAVFKMLNAMLNKGVKWGFVENNPCKKLDTPKYSSPEKKVLTQEQMTLITKEVASEELKYQALFYFAVLCSPRRQMIVGLSWPDINFEEDTFTTRNAAAHVKGKGTIIKEPKTKKSKQTLHLPSILKDILLRLKQEQDIHKEAWGDKWVDEGWVFTQSNGKLMNVTTPSHWWDKFSKRLGIEGITFHGLRHTAATYMLKNNVPLPTVSGVLGHANISTTANIYAHVIEDTKKTAINTMESVLFQTNNQ